MGLISFAIGFILGWVFLTPIVTRIVPFVVGNVCLINIGSFCLNFGLMEILTALVSGILLSLFFQK